MITTNYKELKTKLMEALTRLNPENKEIGNNYSPYAYITNFIYDLSEEMTDGLFFNFDYEEASSNDNYYLMVSYYSNKLNKTIILDSEARVDYENNEALASQLVAYQREAETMEANLYNLVTRETTLILSAIDTETEKYQDIIDEDGANMSIEDVKEYQDIIKELSALANKIKS